MRVRLLAKLNVLFSCALLVTGIAGCAAMKGQTLSEKTVASENKAVVLRSEAELWSKGNLAVADQVYSPDFVCHFIMGREWRGLQGIRHAVKSHRTSFPDWNERVDDIIAEGDRVAIRITSTGTQLGEFEGLKPTRRKITIQEFHIFRLSGGKIVEQWGMPDVQGLMAQLSAPGQR
jgi:predicted ester cyclase